MASHPPNCPFCQGSGLCHRCDGTGFIRAPRARPLPCRECDGAGKCELCSGTGLREEGKGGRSRTGADGE